MLFVLLFLIALVLILGAIVFGVAYGHPSQHVFNTADRIAQLMLLLGMVTLVASLVVGIYLLVS